MRSPEWPPQLSHSSRNIIRSIKCGREGGSVTPEPRKDQQQGGGAGSHRELENYLRVQARSKTGRWSCAVIERPGEIKRREMELVSQKSPGEIKSKEDNRWTIVCGPRRDQEQGY